MNCLHEEYNVESANVNIRNWIFPLYADEIRG